MMRNGQNKRMRGRNRNNNNHSHNQNRGHHHNPLTRVYESNGPDVKIRGTAHHIAEKYLQLARDATSAGDHVTAEAHHQHAEHYFRLIAAAQEQFRQQNPHYQPQPVQQQDGNAEGGQFEGAADETGQQQPQQFNQPQQFSQPQQQPQPQAYQQSQPQPYLNQQPQYNRPQQHQPPQNHNYQQPQQQQPQPQPNFGGGGDVGGLPSFITGGQQPQAPQQHGGGNNGNGHDGQNGERFNHRRRRRHRGPHNPGQPQDMRGDGPEAPGNE